MIRNPYLAPYNPIYVAFLGWRFESCGDERAGRAVLINYKLFPDFNVSQRNQREEKIINNKSA